MQTFTGNDGNEWRITLDTAILRQVRKELDIDLLKLDESSLGSLISDDEKLVDVISFVCTSQILKREMNSESFAAVIVGDTIEDACNALVEELVFISRPGRRAVIQTAWKKATNAVERLNVKAVEVMESPEMTTKLETLVNQFGDSLKTSM